VPTSRKGREKWGTLYFGGTEKWATRPSNLSWIENIINGHGWDEHESGFESKEEYKRLILDTVQNAKGGDISVTRRDGRV